MQLIQAPRASAILYNLLRSQTNHDPWLLPANICPIVPLTFFKAEVPFEFVDISAGTLQMDLEQVQGCLERGKYGGILYAHTYGEPSTPVESFQRIKSQFPDVILVDDRCLCVPDVDPPRTMVADVALYSTGYAKVVDLGFGGFAFMGRRVKYRPETLPFDPGDHEEIEKAYKLALKNRAPFVYQDTDWLQTDDDLPTWYDYRWQIEGETNVSLGHRARLNEIYAERLPPEIQLPQGYQTWRFNLRLKNRDQVLEAIFASGVFASSHYASLAGIMAPGRCPHAEALSGEIINLFNDHHFSQQQAEKVCTVIMESLP